MSEDASGTEMVPVNLSLDDQAAVGDSISLISGTGTEKSFVAAVNRKEKHIQTAVLCLSYVALGLSVGIMGPSFLMIGDNLGEDVDKVGGLFSTRGLGLIMGSLLAGQIHSFMQISHTRQTVRAIERASSTLGWALGTGPVYVFGPIFESNAAKCPAYLIMQTLYVFLGVMWFVGVCMGFVDVGCNTLIFRVWTTGLDPYMQLMHFFFGVGCARFVASHSSRRFNVSVHPCRGHEVCVPVKSLACFVLFNGWGCLHCRRYAVLCSSPKDCSCVCRGPGSKQRFSCAVWLLH